MAAASHTHLQLFVAVLFFSAISAQSTGNSTDGPGIDHCAKCGTKTDTGLPKGTISQCVLKVPDTSNIRASIFSCNCQPRFTGDGITCNDFDECKERTDNCDSHAHCKNTIGSFDCECKSGYRGTGIICKDIDECTEAGSEKNASDIYCNGVGNCVNTPGSYRCECGTGYVLHDNGTSCIDENECDRDNICEQQCINTVGSYYCSCFAGFEPQDPSAPGVSCVNINECERVAALCGENTHCHDTNGSYTCHCNKGFEWESHPLKRHCVDINECEQTPSFNCSQYPNTECHNSYGSAECVCLEGYRGPKEKCENINECTDGTARCDVNAYCKDNGGGYLCICNGGFTGNGTHCNDLNECESKSENDCDPNAKCINSFGNYTCECIYGYEGNGYTCSVKPYNGRNIKEEEGRISRSALLYQYQLLDHERLQLELEHETALRRCATQLQQKRLAAQRARREVIDVAVKTAESLEVMVAILKKRNADLALENHALGITCPE